MGWLTSSSGGQAPTKCILCPESCFHVMKERFLQFGQAIYFQVCGFFVTGPCKDDSGDDGNDHDDNRNGDKGQGGGRCREAEADVVSLSDGEVLENEPIDDDPIWGHNLRMLERMRSLPHTTATSVKQAAFAHTQATKPQNFRSTHTQKGETKQHSE